MVRITDTGQPWDGLVAQVVALGAELVKVQLMERYVGDTPMAQFASQGADPGLRPHKLTMLTDDAVRYWLKASKSADVEKAR